MRPACTSSLMSEDPSAARVGQTTPPYSLLIRTGSKHGAVIWFRNRTKDIDVTEISRDIYDAETAQDKANNDLETASRDGDTTKERIREVKIVDISDLQPTSFQSSNLYVSLDQRQPEQRGHEADEQSTCRAAGPDPSPEEKK